MSNAVSITQDGTVLDTAGKYVEQDIVVGMSDSIKLPAQTFNPSTTDQVIPAGKFLSGAQTIKGDANLLAGNIKQGVSIFNVPGSLTPGITPTGTKIVTANGTYDVTEFAQAQVNVPTGAVNCKRWEITLPNEVTATMNIVTGDNDIKQHYADSNAFALFIRRGKPTEGRFSAINKNQYFYSSNYGFIGHASGSTVGVYPISGTKRDVSMAIYADANGNIGITADASSAGRKWAAGTYDLIFGW